MRSPAAQSAARNASRMQRFYRDLVAISAVAAQRTAAKVAPQITALTASAYDGGRNVYGDSRPRGEDGQALDLVRSGATRRDMRFVAIGSIVRCVIGPRYARYLIGKYGILPNGKAALPAEWSRRLREVAGAELAQLAREKGAT